MVIRDSLHYHVASSCRTQDIHGYSLPRVFATSTVDVVAGSVADGRWCAMFSTNDRLTGVLGVSMPKLVMPSRAMLSTYTSRYDALQHFATVVAAQNK